jgi:hypothetical protein
MLEKFRQFVKHYRELQEIDQLGPEELDDLGLTRDELKLLVQAPEKVTERQMAMAAKFGLTADDFSRNRHDYAWAIAACEDCRAVKQCRHYLASDMTAEQSDFCPNHALYRSLTEVDER